MVKKKRSLSKFKLSRNKIAFALALISTMGLVAFWFHGVTLNLIPIPDEIYQGFNLRVTVLENQRFEISSTGTINIEAGSENYFIIDNNQDVAFASSKSEDLPIGWASDGYYVVQNAQVQSGMWIVRNSAVTIQFTGEEPINLTVFAVQKHTYDTVGNLGLMTFLAVYILYWIVRAIDAIIKPPMWR